MKINVNRVTALMVVGMFVAVFVLMAVNVEAGVQVQADPCPQSVVVQAQPQVACVPQVAAVAQVACVPQVAVAAVPATEVKAKRIGILKRVRMRRQAAREAGAQARNTYELEARAHVVAAPAAQAVYLQQAPTVQAECLGEDDCD